MKIRRLLPLLCLLGLALPAGAQTPAGVAATDAAIEATTRELAAQMRCPVCQGVSIQDSPTELAQEMKSVIRQQLADGRSPEEVKAYFVDRYGEWILLQPEPKGFNLLVYVLPVLGLLAGGGVVAVTVRRWTRLPASGVPRIGAADAGRAAEE